MALLARLALAVAVLAGAVHASLFPDRYAYAPCSLLKELEENCQVKSRLGKNNTEGSYKGLLMYFGETDCRVSIEQCYPKQHCYSFRDLTYQLPSDFTIAGSTGFFKKFNIISGGRDATVSPEGVSFVATSDKVLVEYTTVTCGEFYRYHGRVPVQLCNQPIEAITPIDTRGPNALPCPQEIQDGTT
ncbi:hypothetical protein HXX76_002049 [Chlamydomonas incerta]|uniref:Uncharacterized protein n=1 Tax=Chlamydomonas incerta TaxID=51695 RepID=A0A835WAB2_CHLIN|nr:hypothetical protein HXX76_002049 [Chlamydomonas incerta]|eukprot:KAG2443701.1 hypothetical protein HXX76_002049 [Chlamydomonas incerta]